MKTLFLTLLSTISIAALAQKAVLIEDTEPIEKVIQEKSWFQSKQKSEPINRSEFLNAFDLRAKRRVGVGMSIAGQLGMLGTFAELNFGVQNSTLIGFGTGGSYNSMTMQWKHVFQTEKLTPYTTIGYSRWFSGGQSGSSAQSSPSFLSQKLLTESEKQTGRFGKDLIIPSAGLQYYLLNGPYVGSSLFVEVMLLVSTANMDSTSTGSLGMIYYF